jgi:hypothetical protein
MSSNKVLCICSKCKKKGADNIGKYVHPSTKWRHIKNAKKNFNLDDDDDDDNFDDDDNDGVDDDNDNDNDNEDDDDDDVDVEHRRY